MILLHTLFDENRLLESTEFPDSLLEWNLLPEELSTAVELSGTLKSYSTDENALLAHQSQETLRRQFAMTYMHFVP